MGDARGLTAAGAGVLLLLFAGAGALIDLAFGRDLGPVFAVGFVAASLLAALRVHLEDLAAAIVAPPLLYAFLGLLVTLVHPPTGITAGGLRNLALNYGHTLVWSAPVLALATLLALAVALNRGSRAAQHRAHRR